MGDKSEELATLVTAREIVMLHVIKFLGFSLVLLVSLSVMSGELDYRKLQYPLEDAKSSAQSVFPKFAGFIVEGVKKPRIPGLKQPQEDMVRQKYGINILNEYCLKPILGIQDVNNDERIRFIAGCHGLEALEKKVNDNINSVAFSIFPSKINDVMNVANNNLTMPPKTTWFDPKPLDGLVVYEFNQ